MTSLTPDIVQHHEFDQIRSLLGVDSDVVSNAEIEGLPFLYTVEVEVKAIITDWATIVAAADATALHNSVRLKTGVMAWVAARLCGLVKKKEAGGVKIGDYAESGDKLEWDDRAEELAKMAASSLARISTRTALVRPSVMVLAGPTRSGATVPTDYEGWIERIQPRLLDWVEEGGQEDDDYYGI